MDNDLLYDVSEWLRDSDNTPNSIYPEGMQCKHLIINKETKKKYLFKDTWRREREGYSEWIQHQFWSEYIATKIGASMGLRVPKTFIGLNSRTDEIPFSVGVLSEWFLSSSDTYQKGSEFLTHHIPEYNESMHNLDSIIELTNNKIKDNLTYWMEVMLFDALVGNSDRHHENWGIMNDKEFSPVYDNGISLGWRIEEPEFTNYDFLRDFNKYRYKMKLVVDSPNWAKPKDIIIYFKDKHKLSENEMIAFIERYKEEELREIIERIDSSINPYLESGYKLTKGRAEFITELVSVRFVELKKLIKSAI